MNRRRLNLLIRSSICIMVLLLGLLAAGCSSENKFDNLPEMAWGIDPSEFVNPENPEDTYAMVSIQDRDYIPYGTQKTTITEAMVVMCIAYDNDNEDHRYFMLTDTSDYIADCYLHSEMGQVSFYRAVDTIGKEIDIPYYIEPFDYDIWK